MTKELEYPTELATGLQHLDDVPMPEARIVINNNFAYLDGKPSGSGGGLADPGANGLVKRTGLNVTAMAVAGADYQAALGFTPENVANRDPDVLLAANSDTKYASQRAIKSYVDTGLAAKQGALGYTAEDVANKDTDATMAANSDTRYPSQKAVRAYAIPSTRQVLAGTGLTGGGALSADVTLAAKAMGPSGASHSVGSVPDPGATAGITRFLREDASWVAPPVPNGGPAASAYMTGTSPTFLMGVSTAVPFNATEFDTAGSMHSNTVNNTRLVAPSAGYYMVIASHQFNSASTGTVAKVTVNGADVIGSQTQAVITSFVTAAVMAMVHLTVNDYVEYFITAVSADAPVFTYNDAPRAAPRFQLIRLF